MAIIIYQIVIAAGLVLFLVNLVLNVRSLRGALNGAKIPRPAPLISVLVPARDEADNIGECLASLQSQDYPNFEVLVLDDNSTDATASIVRKMAARDRRIRLVSGKPLAEGWAGKPYACHQLAQEARGEWLLFVDADTLHAPSMLTTVLSTAIKKKTSLLSGFPRQVATSLPQKIVVPLIYFVILNWAPLWWIHRSKKPRPSVAIGQFLFFSRSEYLRIGGHEVVKSRILEDIWMGIEVSRFGGRHIAVDLSSLVSCNMYPTTGSMWNGLIRCIYSVMSMSPLFLLGAIVLALAFYIGPFYWLWNAFFASDISSIVWRGLALSQVAVIFLMRLIVDGRFKEPAVSAWLHPIGIAYLFVLVLYSIWRWLGGNGVAWKKRVYPKESLVE